MNQRATLTYDVHIADPCRSSPNALRIGLRDQGTVVIGVHVSYVDTDATRRLAVPKLPASRVADQAMDAITRDEPEVLVDETTRMVRAKLSGPISDMYSAS